MPLNHETEHLDRLNLGCGPEAPSDWVNVDGSLNAWFTHHKRLRRALELVGIINSANQGAKWNVRPVVHDLRKSLPFPDNAFSGIYASHVLEHLYRTQANALLVECKRVLRPGGVLRVVAPDLNSMVVEYLKSKQNGASQSAADSLNEKLAFRAPAPPTGNPLLVLYSLWKDFHSHKWMYDTESLIRIVESVGFQQVARMEFLRSGIAGIEDVEQSSRVLNGAGVCVEGTKPLHS